MNPQSSPPISFQRLRFPDPETVGRFGDFALSTFDISQVVQPMMGLLPAEAEVRLVRLPEGVGYDWGYRLALSLLDKQGIAIGKLEGAPCVFSNALDFEQVRSMWEGWKRSYDEERNNLTITRDLYPGAVQIVRERVTALLGRLPQPVRILDLASAGGGVDAYFFEKKVAGKYLKVDTDAITLAVLADRARSASGLEVIGLEATIEKITDRGFRARLEARLGGKPHAVVSAFVLHQLDYIFYYDTAVEEWFSALRELLEPGGALLLADFYYPRHVTDADFERSEELYRRLVEQHPLTRVEEYAFGNRSIFKDPEDVRRVLEERGGLKDFQVFGEDVVSGSSQRFFVLEATRA
ncbi:MAG: class I SAM-dependent methyltransferase [Armatimonadetes bacterium]|nr:class I SAM-dependent methyltransferase [Armatimonadota bacterium]